MKIGIVGAGNVGIAVGRRLAAKGHDVVVSFARSPDRVEAAAQEIGNGARAATPVDAAKNADVVVLSTAWSVTLDVVREIAPAAAGKVLWDTTNALKPDLSGLEIGTTTSAGEEVAKTAAGALVAKAIVPFAELLRAESTLVAGRRPAVFVCTDERSAGDAVLRLVGDLDAEGVRAGPLRLARYTEPLGMLLTQLAYVQGYGPRIASVLLRDDALGAQALATLQDETSLRAPGTLF